MKASGKMVLREIAGEAILIPVGETALKLHGMLTLTESGKLLWDKLQEDCTEDELVDAVLSEYEIDRETAKSDVSSFLAKLRALGVLEGNA